MNRTNILFLFLVASALFLSCGGNTASSLQGEGDTIPMRYAKNITMVRYGNNVVEVKLKNPWGEGLLGSYVLMEGPNSQLSTLNSQLSDTRLYCCALWTYLRTWYGTEYWRCV